MAVGQEELQDAFSLALQLETHFLVMPGAAVNLGSLLLDRSIDCIQPVCLVKQGALLAFSFQRFYLALQLGQRVLGDQG